MKMREKPIEKTYLGRGTLLGEDRYRIDELVEDNDVVVTYQAYDIFRQKPVKLYELFPKALVERNVEDNREVVLRLLSSESLFRSMKSHMIARAKKLIGLYPLENAGNILAYFEANKTVYVIEEMTAGAVTLEYYLQKRHSAKFTVEDLVKLTRPLFALLNKLHSKGIWHGSITPRNILLTEERKPLLTHLTDPVEDIASELLGDAAIRNLAFSPVEMFVEEGKRGPLADVFAMGAVFYRYTTGEELPPYYERINDKKEPIPPKEMKTRIMDFQSDAIMKAVALYDFDRFERIDQFLAQLAPADMDTDSLHSQQEEVFHMKKLPFWYRREQKAARRYTIVIAALVLIFLVLFLPRFSDLVRDHRINRFYKRFDKATEYEQCQMLSQLLPSERGLYANDFMSLPDDYEDEEERSKLMHAKVFDFQLGHYVDASKINTNRTKYDYVRIDYMLGQAWVTYLSDEKNEHKEITLKPAIDGSYTVRSTKTDENGKTTTVTEKVKQ